MRFEFAAFFENLHGLPENGERQISFRFKAFDQKLEGFLRGIASAAVEQIGAAENEHRFSAGEFRQTCFQA